MNPTVDQLQEFINEGYKVFASERVTAKRIKELVVNLRGGIEVYHNGECVLQCMQPFAAIEKYNSIEV